MGLVVHNLSWKLETPEKFLKIQGLGPTARASDLIGLGSAQAGGVYRASRLRTTAAGRQEGTVSVQLGNFIDRCSLSEVWGWGLAFTPTWGGQCVQKVSSGGGTEGGPPPENRCCSLNFLPLPGPSPGQSGFSFDQPQIYLLSLLGWKRLVEEGTQSLAELVSILT